MKARKRKDSNHRTLTEAVRAVGAVAIDCTGDPSIGFDEIWLFRGSVWLIEIKDGAKVKSARKLTQNEAKRHNEAQTVDCTIHVVESVLEALALIGALE